jgi:hypothetical protein
MAKVQLDVVGKDKGASSAVGSVTKSLVTATLAIEGIKIATKALIDVGKKSIEALRQQEQILAKLEVQTDGNTESIEAWSSEIQNATTVGDEASQQIASLALSMGVTQDKLEDATKGAIGLSESLGIDLTSAMKMVALANEGEFNMLSRYIPALRTATTDAEKQAIVQQAMANGFDLAKAKAETFTGRLEQLKNAQGDNLESFGRIVAVVGKDFVESMIDGQKAISDFLNDADRIAAIASSFKILGEVGKELGSVAFKELKNLVGDIADDFGDLAGEGDKAQMVFQGIAFATKSLSMALSIAFKVLGLIIKPFMTMAKVGKEVIQVFQSVWDVIKGRADAKEVLDNLKDVGNAYKDGYTEILGNFKNLITETTDEFKSFNADTKETAKSYTEIWAKSNAKVKEDFAKTKDEIKAKGGLIDNDKEGEAVEKSKSNWKKWVDVGVSSATKLVGAVQDIMSAHYETLLSANAEWQENQLGQVDEWINRELEMQGVKVATREEQLQKEIDTLHKSIGTQTTATDRARKEEEIKEKKAELTRLKIQDEGEKRKADIMKKGKDKETALKKKQFEENKAFQIANVWISAAAGIVGAWAGAAQWPGPSVVAGMALAGVLTGIITTMAGVQTGLIAGSTFHGEQGGLVQGGGPTGDNARLFANKGEALLRNDDFNALVGMARGEGGAGGDIFISELIVVANNPAELSEQLLEIQRQERSR